MPQVFISYRRGATGYVATLLADELRTKFGPKAIFMDIDNIPLGVDFRDHITAAVSECHVLLALIGDDWLTCKRPDGTRRIDDPEDFVRIEIEAALLRGLPVVPILTNAATVPAESDLPASLRQLAFRNAAELRSGRDLKGQMRSLIGQLSTLGSSEEPASAKSSSAVPSSARSRWSKSRLIVTATCAIIAVVALLLFFAQRNGLSPTRRSNVREVILQSAAGAPITLYKGPDRHSATLGSVRRGSSALIIDTFRGVDGQMWSQISMNPGWLAARNLADPEYAMLRPVSTTTLQVGQPAVVTYSGSDGLNLRESPNVQSRVIAYLLAGTQVTISNDKLTTSEHEWWGVELPPAYILSKGISE